MELVDQAYKYFQPGNYRRETSLCLSQLARAYRRKGNYAEALKALAQKLELAQQGGDQPQVAAGYGEIGAVLMDQERYPEALEKYDQALAMNRTLGNVINIAFNLENRGEILWELGRYDEANEALKEAEKIASNPDSRYKQLIPEIERSLGDLALSQRRLADAQLKARHTIELCGTLYPTVTIRADLTLARERSLSGSHAEAKKLCAEAVKLAGEQGEDFFLLTLALLTSAEVALESGDAHSAAQLSAQAQERFLKGGQQESAWRAWLLAARANQQLNNTQVAGQQLARAKELLLELQQRWGANAFNLYLARPDILAYNKQLG
jgi:tetratricopeptide (TPR) repeat protein